MWTPQLLIHTYIHISILWIILLPLFQLWAAPPPPASTQHPEITAFPSGRQAVEGTAMDVFSLLSNERRNATVGLSAGPSQPSIHTCGISTVYQTAGRQLCSLFLTLLLSFSFSFSLSFFPSIPLTLSVSPQYVPLTLSISDHKQAEAQVCFAGTPLPASPSPSIIIDST